MDEGGRRPDRLRRRTSFWRRNYRGSDFGGCGDSLVTVRLIVFLVARGLRILPDFAGIFRPRTYILLVFKGRFRVPKPKVGSSTLPRASISSSQSALVNGTGWLGIEPAVVTLLPDNVFRSLLYKGGLATGWLVSRVLEPQADHPISQRIFFDWLNRICLGVLPPPA